MSRKKATAGASRIRSAQNLVRGSADPWAGVSRARGILSTTDVGQFVDWLPSVRRAGRGIPSVIRRPASIHELWTGAALAKVDLAREIAWTSALISREADTLSKFRCMALKYERRLVSGRLDGARETLDAIEETFGTSMWVMETRIALLQATGGLEAQKAHASDVRAARGRNDVVAFLAHLVSRRNEPGTTPMRFVREVEDMVAVRTAPDGLAPYIAFRAANLRPTEPAGYAHVLRLEAGSSIVDLHDTFVRLAQDAVLDQDERTSSPFRGEVVRVAGLTDDERLRRTAFIVTGDGRWLERSCVAPTDDEDALAVGDYAGAAKLASARAEVDPLDAASWLTEARALAEMRAVPRTPDDLRSAITARASLVASRGEGMDAAAISLLKDALNHRLLGFSAIVEPFVWGELSDHPDPPFKLARSGFVHGSRLHASDVGAIPGQSARSALVVKLLASGVAPTSASLADQALRTGISTDGATDLSVDTGSLPGDAATEARMTRALSLGRHDVVMDLASGLASTADGLRGRRVKRFLAHSLLMTDRIPELASFIAQGCVADPDLAGMLPLSECAARLNKDLRRAHAGDLAMPIVLDLFSKHCEDSKDDLRAYAYEDFLLAHEVERPSQLEPFADGFDQALLIYYLRFLCVPGVMQVSSAYQGTRELENERKSVLSLLVKLDPAAAKDYETELRDVTRAQLIHGGVRHVERSKIYVDVPAIRRAFEKAHKETFQRYQEMKRAGIGADDREFEEALQGMLSGKPVPRQVLEVPKNETSDLLLQMLRWLFAECTTSPEHGLDCYLSMRIRHGTLSGQLRTPLEMERLITQRAAATDDYERNAHWIDRLTHLGARTCAAIDECLAEFSAGYDACIARVANDLIQIRSQDKPNGLFNISLGSVRFRLWITELTPDMTFDAFFERAMELFWQSVESSLTTVRDTMDEQVKPQINAMFSDLEVRIGRLTADHPTSDLDRAIRIAQTSTLQALDIVKDWFRLSQSTKEPDFPIEDLIDVGLQCVKTIHRDFSPTVVQKVDPMPPMAHALVLFSDIFFIVFDNIRRHSGVGPSPRVEIGVEGKGDRLRIAVRSEMSAAARASADIARIDAIKRAIDDGEYQHAVKSEGGTGLMKLRKLIGKDDYGQHRLDFGYDDECFHLELEFAIREMRR